MGTMRRGSGSVAGGVPFVATTLTRSGAQSLDPEMENLITHALTAEGFDASEDGTGRGTPIVPVDLAQVTSRENRSNPKPGDPNGSLAATSRSAVAYALRAGTSGAAQGHNTNFLPVAFGHTNGIDVQASTEITPTLRAGHDVGGGSVASAAAVRRLTPVECERLQGYPDGWTAVAAGKDQADSARYRQLGNSIAVPVFAWVAQRIVAVDEAGS
jgi:DNA (cytosine-5)-methyltransferase 1